MSKTRYDLCVPRPAANNKTWWQKVGAAWVGDDGKVSIKLDCLPVGNIKSTSGDEVPFDGWIKAFEAKDGGSKEAAKSAASQKALDDDEIPY